MKKFSRILLVMAFVFSNLSFQVKPNVVRADSYGGTVNVLNRESMEDTRFKDKPEPFEDEPTVSDENLALNKTAQASSSFSICTAEKAVDGITTRDSRWQSGEDVTTFKPVSLILDLEGKSEASSLKIKFDTKMYGNFIIETSATQEEDSWQKVATIDDVPTGTENHIEYNKSFGEEPIQLERYVRFYFTSSNPNAMNKSIGIQELELYGQAKTKVEGNLALLKNVRASKESGSYLPNFANDGVSDVDQERWQSGEDVSSFSPVWLEFDLAEASELTGINIKFARRLYGNFILQTSEGNGNDAVWENLHTVTDIASSSVIDPPVKTWAFETVQAKRYVRLYFTDVNPQAGNKSIGIFEAELIGTQYLPTRPVSPTSAQQVISNVNELRVNEEGTQIVFPKVDDKFEITLKGSDLKNTISNDGLITNYNFDAYDVDVLVQVVSKEDSTDRAEKNLVVHIPSKTSFYPELFPSVSNPNEEPVVIPSLQEWYGYDGNFVLSDDSRIVVNDSYNLDLNKVALELQKDLKEFTGQKLEVVSGDAGAHDIELNSLDKDYYDLGDEGYLIINNDMGLKIYSQTYTGALYGAVTVKQVFYKQRASKEFSFPKGVIRDYPQFEVRGVMMDVGRIPYRLDTLNNLAKAFSFYKINEMHVHLNDDLHESAMNDTPNNNWEKAQARFSGFRLKSDTFPSLGPDERSNDYFSTVQYTKESYKDFQKDAKNYGVSIVSEIDAPGHALGFNKYVENNREEAAAVGITGNIRNKENAELLALSGENYENAAKFIRLIFDEYIGINDGVYNEDNAVFIGDTIHIGADEYWEIPHNQSNPENAEQRRNYGEYVKDMYEKVTLAGKKTRIWGHVGSYLDKLADFDTLALNDVVLDAWYTGHENIQKRIEQGYSMINVDEGWLYGNPGRDRRDVVNVEYLYENWTPYMMNGYTFKKGEPALLGAKTALWADINLMGVTERDTFDRLIRGASVLAEKTWGGTNKDSSFDDFSFAFSNTYGGPGVNIAKDIPSVSDQVLDYNFDNAVDKEISDYSGNEYSGTITGGTLTKEENQTWLNFDGSTEIASPVDSLSYPYTVQFDLNISSTEMSKNTNAQLFDGYDGRLSITPTGKLVINRSYHVQEFKYVVPTDKKVNITLVGTQQVLKLYIDGVFEEALLRINSDEKGFDNQLSTFVFPLETIGTGFNGQLANLRVYKKAMNPQLIADTFNNVIQTTLNISQNKGVSGNAQNPNEGGWDNGAKKLQVPWKAIDGDGNTLEGTHLSTQSDKDSFFNGKLSDSNISLDFYKVFAVSKIVLEFDQEPTGTFALQTSEDGKTWAGIGTYSSSNIEFEESINTRFLRLVGNNFKLREIEVYETVNKASLNEAIDKAKTKATQSPTSFTLANSFDNVYRLALSVSNNAMANQAIIDEADENLRAYLDAVDKTDLNTLITSVASLVEADYTADSWSALQTVVDEAKVLVASARATQAEVDAMTLKLQTAASGLKDKPEDPVEVDLTAINEKLASVAVLIEVDYTADSWSALQTVVDEAEVLIANAQATQEEIDAMTLKLQTAASGLKDKPVDPDPDTDLDTSLLEFMITEADKQVEEGALVGVIEAVVERFNKALKEAKAILVKADIDPTSVTQAEIDLATKNLIDMLHMLDFKGTKGLLQNLVAKCERYVADKALYSKATYDVFEAALEGAKTVLADKTAFQDEIDKAWFDLATGLAGLRKIPNKDALKGLLDKARSINPSQYTVASFRALADATDDANSVYNDKNATVEAVVSSEKAVKIAMDGLVPLVATTTDDTDTDGTSTTTKASDSDKVVKVADTTTKAATSVPKTGENSLAMLLFTLLSLSCVVTVVIRKKKVK